MSKQSEGQKMADWDRWEHPMMYLWDPIPFWVIPHDKLEQIIGVQLDSMIEMKKNDVAKLERIRDIVVGKCK